MDHTVCLYSVFEKKPQQDLSTALRINSRQRSDYLRLDSDPERLTFWKCKVLAEH